MFNSLHGHSRIAAAAVLAALSWATTARADAGAAAGEPPAAAAAAAGHRVEAASPQPAAARTTGLLSGLRPVTPSVLAASRGGTQVLNDMRLNGVVTDNHASDLFTGSNSISDGAFANASGLPMVVQNSGNNVLIQNATIVNVQVK